MELDGNLERQSQWGLWAREFSYRGTGGLHGNMVWETPTFPLRVFCSGSLPTPQCYQRSLNFLGWDHMSPGVLGQNNLSNTECRVKSLALLSFNKLCLLSGGARWEEFWSEGYYPGWPSVWVSRVQKTGSGRLGGCELPKIRMNHSLISEGSTCCYNKQTHKTSYF